MSTSKTGQSDSSNIQSQYQQYFDAKNKNEVRSDGIQHLRMHDIVKGVGEDIQGFQNLSKFEQQNLLQGLKARVTTRENKEAEKGWGKRLLHRLNNAFIRGNFFKGNWFRTNAELGKAAFHNLESITKSPANLTTSNDVYTFFETFLTKDSLSATNGYKDGDMQKLFSDKKWMGDKIKAQDIIEIAQKNELEFKVYKDILLGLISNEDIKEQIVHTPNMLEGFLGEFSNYSNHSTEDTIGHPEFAKIEKAALKKNLMANFLKDNPHIKDNAYGFFKNYIDEAPTDKDFTNLYIQNLSKDQLKNFLANESSATSVGEYGTIKSHVDSKTIGTNRQNWAEAALELHREKKYDYTKRKVDAFNKLIPDHYVGTEEDKVHFIKMLNQDEAALFLSYIIKEMPEKISVENLASTISEILTNLQPESKQHIYLNAKSQYMDYVKESHFKPTKAEEMFQRFAAVFHEIIKEAPKEFKSLKQELLDNVINPARIDDYPMKRPYSLDEDGMIYIPIK